MSALATRERVSISQVVMLAGLTTSSEVIVRGVPGMRRARRVVFAPEAGTPRKLFARPLIRPTHFGSAIVNLG